MRFPVSGTSGSSETAAAPASSSVPVLIVDDDASKRFALKTVLLPLGYSLVEADSGEAALRCVMAQDFAVILLDMKMPEMGGPETAARIRTRRQSEMTPIIFITSYSRDEILPTDGYLEGAVDFIFAPVQPDELRAKVSFFANLFAKATTLARQAQEVQQSADHLRLLTDAAPIGIFQTDSDNRYIYTNPRWTEITGIAADEAAGHNWDSFPDSDERTRQVTELPYNGPQPSDLCQRFEISEPGLDSRIVLATSEPLPDGHGGIAGWVGTLADVTAAARAREIEDARRDAEDRYRRIVETTIEGIWVIDADDKTTFVNEPMARMLQLSVAEMQGRSISEFCDAQELRKAEQSIDRRRAGASERFELKLRRSDGSEMHGLLSANAMFDESGAYAGSVAMVSDDTERVEQEERRQGLEEQLRQSQRLESIGQLAGGIAHDFNNLLLGIRGFGELALGRIERGENNAEYVRDMLEAADRATQLTRQLLAFGRRQVLRPEVIDLCHVVASMERLLKPLIGEQVELIIASPEEPVLVEADRTQLEQVIVNLVVNGRDAMPDGGALRIEVSRSNTTSAEAVLTVSDNGCGMDPETSAHIFEPFFTTKGDGGSGFGLATVYGIVSQSCGRIVLDSELGSGSTFSIFLPLSTGILTPSTIEPTKSEGGKETILVAEDDAMVRSIVTAMLDGLGYRVLPADGGTAALELAAASGSEIDLVLTDLVMPGLSGRETAGQVRELFPDAKVLYMSGYTNDVVIRAGAAFDSATAFIQKPFGADELARAVRDVLEAALV